MYADTQRNFDPSERFEFVGRLADEEVRKRYLWKSVAHFFKPGAANPIMYVGPHRRPTPAAESAIPVPATQPVDEDTVIVAARRAYPEYLKSAAYICQPERYFRDEVTHLGFYAESQIKPEIAEVLYMEESVIFTQEEADRRMASAHADVRRVGEIISDHLDARTREAGEAYKVILLSQPSDARTLHLSAPIQNDKVTATGKPWGWTLGQRYTSLNRLLRGPRLTSRLDIGTDEEQLDDSRH